MTHRMSTVVLLTFWFCLGWNMIFFGERVRARSEEPEESELESELALSEIEPLLCLLIFVAGEISELEESLEELVELEELEELEELLELEDDEELETSSFPLVLSRLNIGPRGGASTSSFSSENDNKQYSSLTTLPFTLHSSLGMGVQLDPGLV